MDLAGNPRMKTLWPPWCCLCLALCAGCSSSSAKQSEEVTAHKKSAQPEWAMTDASAAQTSATPQIHPIPDDIEDSSADRDKQVVIKPFPLDDLH